MPELEPTARRRPPPTPEELRLRELGLWPFISVEGRISQLPAKASRRTHVLTHVADAFDRSSTYDEKQINEMLAPWCADGEVDHVTIRRYLIDEGLLTRTAGVYRRS